MWKCDPNFESLLSCFSEIPELEIEGTVYGLWPDLTLACFNRAWRQFALQNGGDPDRSESMQLGASIVDSLGPLKEFYVESMIRSLTTHETWTHEYECSSPQRYRRFQMRSYPLGDAEGLLIVNSLLVERPHEVSSPGRLDPSGVTYRDLNGLIQMCTHCRRCRRQAEGSGSWDWVPSYVENMPTQVTHGLCPLCYDYHYSRMESRNEQTS